MLKQKKGSHLELCYTKPTCGIEVLQRRQGHSVVFHFLIADLNDANDFTAFISFGTSSHIFGAR